MQQARACAIAAPLVVTWHNAVLARGLRGQASALVERIVARAATLTLGASEDLVERAMRLFPSLEPHQGWYMALSVQEGGNTLATNQFAVANFIRVLPEVRMRSRDLLLGAVVTSLLFSLGTSLVGLYVAHKGTSSTFGAAGSPRTTSSAPGERR